MAGRVVGQGRGSVYVGGTIYLEGSTIPSDVEVGDHVFTDVDDDSAGQVVVNQPVVSADVETPASETPAPAKKAAPAKKSASRSRGRSRSRS